MLYTPSITKNLLSVGTLADHNKTLIFRKNGCFVLDNDTLQIEIFALRETTKGLYRLSGAQTTSRPVVNMIYPNSPATLWHKRLGHFHTKGLQRMFNFGAVTGLSPLHFSNQPCTGCHLGKNARKKMPKQTRYHTEQILELIHSDVCGPFRVKSLGGCRYFATFIDDYSRRVWIYFLSNKSQVLSKFQHFVHQVKTATGRRVKALRTDNGGEYISREFSDYWSSKGITRELVPPYTPERNGVAERKNRSILDITRCLLLDKVLPSHLWGEAVKAAGDILNLRSTKHHPDKTLEELFYDKKPSIGHLRVFGSPAFVHIPKVSRSKLDPRSEQCVLLSFDSTAKAYRCYRPSTRKVFVSRDVSIDETASTSAHQPTSSPDDLSVSDTPAPTNREELLTRLPLPTAVDAAEDHPTAPPNSPPPSSLQLCLLMQTERSSHQFPWYLCLLPIFTLFHRRNLPVSPPLPRHRSPGAPTEFDISQDIYKNLLHTFGFNTKIFRQRNSQITLPLSKPVFIPNGKLPCRRKLIQSMPIKHGHLSPYLLTRRPSPPDGFLSSKLALTANPIATKLDLLPEALNRLTESVLLKPSPPSSAGKQFGFSSPSSCISTGLSTSSMFSQHSSTAYSKKMCT